MKRFILLLAVVLGMSAPAYAQLDIKKVGEKAKEVATLSSMWNWLKTIDEYWYIVTKTTNRFDDHIWILLGDTPEKAIASIEQLQALLDEMADDDIFQVTAKDGLKVKLGIYKQMGGRQGFTVNAAGFSGVGYIYKGSLKRAKEVIEKKVAKESETE